MGEDRVSIEPFKGNGQDAQSWITKLDMYFKSYTTKHQEDRSKVAYATYRIDTESSAWKWIESLYKVDSEGLLSDWEKWKTKFIELYGDPLRAQRDLAEWETINQEPEEGVTSYISRFRTLSATLNFKVSEASMARKLFSGLDADIQTRLVHLGHYTETKTFEEIAKEAILAEKSLELMKLYSKNKNFKKEEYSYESKSYQSRNNYKGHNRNSKSSNSNSEEESGSEDNSENSNSNSSNSEESYKAYNQEVVQCYNCGKKGHYSTECWSKKRTPTVIVNNNTQNEAAKKNVTCYYCSKQGHYAYECNKKKADQQSSGRLRTVINQPYREMEIQVVDEEEEIEAPEESEVLAELAAQMGSRWGREQ